MKLMGTAAVVVLSGAGALAQAAPSEQVPLYRITVVGRTAKAINYQHRGGPTTIDFRGTVLMPEARGEARVESKRGAVQIEARWERLEPPTRFGPRFLTYVLWAITPEGRAVNLGEVAPGHDNKARLKTASELQTFGLIVTAEPYYSVTQPSDVVVMENAVRPDTAGKVETIEAKYELLPRGTYTYDPQAAAASAGGKKVSMDEYEALVELYQARNAVQIARSAGADRYAADTYRKAEQLLQQAEEQHRSKAGRKNVVMTARQAAQTAEDARLIATRRQDEEREKSAPRVGLNR